jgi:hypothetical protein
VNTNYESVVCTPVAAEEIERIGLEPFHAPKRFPPITPEDVRPGFAGLLSEW